MKKKTLIIISYLYLLLPMLIFSAGWLRWYLALTSIAAMMIALFLAGRQISDETDVITLHTADIVKLLFVLGIISFWVFISGIGGMSYQTSDHEARTAIFRALVEYDWPVRSNTGSRALIYYIGFWLPSAVVGKIFGFQIGYWFQAIWAVTGIFLVYLLICFRKGRVLVWPLLILIFFSGLDYVGAWLLNRGWGNLQDPTHLEWWAVDFQYSSFTTQLFWVFNQSIPAWLATMLIFSCKKKKNVLFIMSTIMLSSTFPFVGLIPFVIYKLFEKTKIEKGKIRQGIREWIKEFLSVQNVVGVFVIGIICLLYLILNTSAGKVGGDAITGDSEFYDFSAMLIKYFLFCLLEFGVYVIFVEKHYRTLLYWIVVGTLFCSPLLQVGEAHDFCMRASIPALFVLMLMVMDSLEIYFQNHEWKKFIPLIVLFLIGAITPVNEIHRSLIETVKDAENEESSQQEEYSIEEEVLEYGNFSGELLELIFKDNQTKQVEELDVCFNADGNTFFTGKQGKYTGEYKNNHANGEGVVVYEDGTELTGTFENGLPDGSMTYYFSDGTYAEFKCSEGVAQGICKYYDEDGSITGYDWFSYGTLMEDLKKASQDHSYEEQYSGYEILTDEEETPEIDKTTVVEFNGTVQNIIIKEKSVQVRIENEQGQIWILQYSGGAWSTKKTQIVPNLEIGDQITGWGYPYGLITYAEEDDPEVHGGLYPEIEPFQVEVNGETTDRLALSFTYESICRNPYLYAGISIYEDTRLMITGTVRSMAFTSDTHEKVAIEIEGGLSIGGEQSKGIYYVTLSTEDLTLPSLGETISVKGAMDGNYKKVIYSLSENGVSDTDYEVYPLIKGHKICDIKD